VIRIVQESRDGFSVYRVEALDGFEVEHALGVLFREGRGYRAHRVTFTEKGGIRLIDDEPIVTEAFMQDAAMHLYQDWLSR